MTTVTTKARMKVAAVATGLAMALSMLAFAPMAQAALTASQVSAIVLLLQSFGADASTIANVQASLTGGTPVTTTTTTTATSGSCAFTRSLTIASTGADVTCLQKALIAGGYSIPVGATGYFGTQTRAAVLAWQKAKGVTPAVGFFGVNSRAAWNLGGTTTTPVTPTTPGTTPITGTGLKVSLATDSPSGAALVQGQAVATLAKFTFSNPTSAEIKVTNVSFKRIGVSNDSTLSNVYLYWGAKRLTDSAGVSNSAFNFNDPTGLFTVSAGGTYTVSVLADIAGSTSGQQIGTQLTAVASSGTLDSSVSFPVSGGLQTVSAATLATVDFGATTLPATNTALAPANDVTVWQNTVTIGTRAVTLSSFQLKNIGSIAKTDINNLRLYVDGVQVGTASTLITDSQGTTVNWDLSASPKKLETGGRVVKVVGDVVGGSSLTFKLSLQRGSDGMMIDTDLNQPILATYNGSVAFVARASGVQTISSGTISVVKATNSPSSNVSLGGTNIKFATFELRAAGEDIKVDNLNVQADTSVSIRGLDNGKVFLNGVQVGSTKDLTGNTDVNFTFGSSMILKAGTTAIVDIYADAKSTTGAAFITGETAQITLALSTDNGTGQVSLSSIAVPAADVLGTALTVSASSMTQTKYSGYGNQTLVAGSPGAKMGSFTLSTGSTEGVNVNTITVTLSTANAASITDLILRNRVTGTVSDAQIGTTKAPSTSNSFSVNLNVAASATQTIDVYANIKPGANAGTWVANVDGSGTGLTTGTSVTFGDSTVALQTITLAAGALTTAVGVSPNNANVIAGSSEVKVGSFKFTAQYSNFTVQELKVKIPADAASSVSAVILKWKGGTASKDLSVSSGAQTHATSTFTGLSFVIAQNTEETLDVFVSIPTIADAASTGKAITVTLDGDEGFRAISSGDPVTTLSSSADLSSVSATGKGTMYVRKSIPSVSAVALSTSERALADGSNKVIGRFTVTADATGTVGWKYLSFTMTKTAAITLGATTTVLLYEGSNSIGGNFATTTTTLGLGTMEMFTVAATSGFIVFEASTEQQVTHGSPITYELRTTVGGVTPNDSLDLSLANPTTSIQGGAAYATVRSTFGSTVPSIIWTDRSSITTVHSESTTDWTNDYLIKTLPLTVGNLVSGT